MRFLLNKIKDGEPSDDNTDIGAQVSLPSRVGTAFGV
jgi:hypothetical protein